MAATVLLCALVGTPLRALAAAAGSAPSDHRIGAAHGEGAAGAMSAPTPADLAAEEAAWSAQPVPARALATPARNLAPSPDFLQSCASGTVDRSTRCESATLAAIDRGRRSEGLPPMLLPADWSRLSPGAQLLVATNLERSVRHLPALAVGTVVLDAAARSAARHDTDPSMPASVASPYWTSNWAADVGSPLEAVYLWMYDDGYGGPNVDCTHPGAAGCWGHRSNILAAFRCRPCAMGVALDATGYKGAPSWTELLADLAVRAQPAVQLTGTAATRP